ncbi:MAG TPA: phage tail protein, partial [Bacteroidia bacterium]|nr:phage tail protein [Bacteroidia bacterium]
FQSVDGLKVEIPNSEKHEEGGENTFTHRFPGRISFGDLTLKRGMLIGSDLIQWFDFSTQLFIFAPRDITISLMDETGNALDQWVFRNAWPKSWDIEGFKAETSAVAVESIVFSYQYFYRKGKSI